MKKFRNILHTESSPGWGGQERRILQEAEGMRARGYKIFFAVQKGGGLVKPAREAGFSVFEITFSKMHLISAFIQLLTLIYEHKIHLINTHSSLDAWLAGIAGKISGCRVVRTRHLSTPIRKGLNSRLLYNWLADSVVTTCQEVVNTICEQAHLPERRCRSIPTGIAPQKVKASYSEIDEFKKKYGIHQDDVVVGTLCVLRGWKGVTDLLKAAKLLEHIPNLKWLIVGSGPSESLFRKEWKELKLEERVFFTGHLDPPFTALAAMDIFLLLSWANEGVSQASLQAAWLSKPLVTTKIGGLPEVSLHGKTGFNVEAHTPTQVADAVLKLYNSPDLRKGMGNEAHKLVKERFLLEKMLEEMESTYSRVCRGKDRKDMTSKV